MDVPELYPHTAPLVDDHRVLCARCTRLATTRAGPVPNEYGPGAALLWCSPIRVVARRFWPNADLTEDERPRHAPEGCMRSRHSHAGDRGLVATDPPHTTSKPWIEALIIKKFNRLESPPLQFVTDCTDNRFN
jgi:hypothetical protein